LIVQFYRYCKLGLIACFSSTTKPLVIKSCSYRIAVKEERLKFIGLFFLTCDYSLIKRLKRLKLEFVVMNPVDYIRQEIS